MEVESATSDPIHRPPDPLQAPLVPIAVGLATGIALDAALTVPLAAAVTLFAVGFGGLLVPAGRVPLRFAMLGLAAIGPGSLMHHNAYRRADADRLVAYVAAEPRQAHVTATVLTRPVITPPDMGGYERWMGLEPRTRFVAQVERIDAADGPVSVYGRLMVFVQQPQVSVGVGDRVDLHGRLFRLRPPQNPGAFDWANHQRRRGILVGMRIKHAASVRPIDRSETSGWDRMIGRMRRWATLALLDDVAPDEAGGTSLLTAMILGQRSSIDQAVNDAFLRTGTGHFLAVSGVHVGILALFVWWVCSLIGGSMRTGALGCATTVILYALLTEPRPSVFRATILVCMASFSVCLRRPLTYGNWIAVAAIVLLVIRPVDLFDVGFQLSFACTLAVVYVCPVLLDGLRTAFGRPSDDVRMLMVRPRGWWPRHLPHVTGNLGAAFTTAISAWIVATPLVMFHFGRFSPYGWFNSILILPLVLLVMLIGFAKLLLGFALPATSVVTGPVLGFLAGVLETLSKWLSHMPGTIVEVSSPSPAWIGLYYLTLIAWTIRSAMGFSRRVPAALAVTTLVLGGWGFVPATRQQDRLAVHVLAVGDGSATVIELPDGRTLLYDAGSRGGFDVGRNIVVPFLSHVGVRGVDTAVISHPNLDHYAGMLSIDDRIAVGRWLLTPHFERLSGPGSPSRYFFDALAERGATVETIAAGDAMDGGDGVRIEVLWPPRSATTDSANDTSLVLRLHHAGRSILLCGDIEEAPQRMLLEQGRLDADVLVLPHHGGVERTTEAFIEAVDPRYLIRSSGMRDHATRNGLIELIRDRTYFNTADDGAITVTIDDHGVTVTPFAQHMRQP